MPAVGRAGLPPSLLARYDSAGTSPSIEAPGDPQSRLRASRLLLAGSVLQLEARLIGRGQPSPRSAPVLGCSDDPRVPEFGRGDGGPEQTRSRRSAWAGSR